MSIGLNHPSACFPHKRLVSVQIRVESGSDDPDNLGHLGYFLVGQVGLIHTLNYLDVTRKSHVL